MASRVPGFFIVGNPKCGTTALHDFLGQHPGIFMPRLKEPHHFAKDFWVGRQQSLCQVPTLEDYLALFAPASAGQLCGEASSNYLYSRAAARELHAFNPDARIVILFREPVSFLRSYHLQLVKNVESEVEDVPDFRRALELEPQRKRGARIPARCQVPEFLYYRERVRYAEQLQRFLDVFPREQLEVLLYEELQKDNLGVVRELFQFLGVEPGFVPAIGVHNPGGTTVRSKLLHTLVHDASRGQGAWGGLQRLGKRLLPPEQRRALLGFVYGRLVFAEAKPADEAFSAQLKDELRGEVLALGELLGRDLVRLWGY